MPALSKGTRTGSVASPRANTAQGHNSGLQPMASMLRGSVQLPGISCWSQEARPRVGVRAGDVEGQGIHGNCCFRGCFDNHGNAISMIALTLYATHPDLTPTQGWPSNAELFGYTPVPQPVMVLVMFCGTLTKKSSTTGSIYRMRARTVVGVDATRNRSIPREVGCGVGGAYPSSGGASGVHWGSPTRILPTTVTV